MPNFEWTEDCQEAFDDFKRYLSSAHVLSIPLLGEELLIYLVASKQTISAVLMREEERIQKLIFYISKVLKGADIRYLNIEKLAFILLLTLRKFKMYLEDHQG